MQDKSVIYEQGHMFCFVFELIVFDYSYVASMHANTADTITQNLLSLCSKVIWGTSHTHSFFEGEKWKRYYLHLLHDLLV